MRRRSVLSLMLAALAAPLPGSLHAAEPVRLLLYGDSLMAGYGLNSQDGFEGQLARALAGAGVLVRIINASVSGDTSAGGLARLDWTLTEPVDAAILCLGANDGLRGLDPGALERNLNDMIGRMQSKGIKVLLAGMRAPRNLGAAYTDRFDAIYPRLAAERGVGFYPFFLEGVAADPALNQGDGIHPNAAGVEKIVRQILPAVQSLLQSSSPPIVPRSPS